MAPVINATTKQRHQAIFDTYLKVIAEHGEDARNLSKKSMYEEVAKKTGYSWERVCTIITKRFKENHNGSTKG